jgi:hypothetical protein
MITILINCVSPMLVEEEGQEVDLGHIMRAFMVDLDSLPLLLLDHPITL